MTGTEATSYLDTSVRLKVGDIAFGHAWAADDRAYAIIRFTSHASIRLASSVHADELIAAATKARDALAELEASAPPATPEERADFEAWRTARAHEAALGPLPSDDSTEGSRS